MRLDTNLPQYDEILLQTAFTRMGISFTELGKKAKVADKTAANVVRTGRAHPKNIYKVAKALGFKVERNDLSEVMRNGKRRSA